MSPTPSNFKSSLLARNFKSLTNIFHCYLSFLGESVIEDRSIQLEGLVYYPKFSIS